MKTRSLLIVIGILFLTANVPVAVLETSIAENNASATHLEASASEGLPHPRKRAEAVSVMHRSTPKTISQRIYLVQAPQTTPQEPVLLAAVQQPDILPHHQQIADDALRSLPRNCLSSLKRLYVRYDHPEHRGLAGKSSIIIDGSVPDDEFRALLIHEFGHITDLGCLQGNSTEGTSAFRDGTDVIYTNDPSVSFYTISWIDAERKRAETRKADFVSGYAGWDPFEDFAETYAYYILQHDAFEERAQKNSALAAKYQWMETHVFRATETIAAGSHQWTGKVPWDVTKLSYVWNS